MRTIELFETEDAVSPVIGVILMVAITVIMAAVATVLVMGIGNDVQATPQADFEFSYDGTDVTITHNGGDPIKASNLYTKVNSSSRTQWSGSGDVTAGDSTTLTSVGTGATVRVIWEGENGETAILQTYEVP